MKAKAILFVIVSIVVAIPVRAGQFKVTRVNDGDIFEAVGHDIEIKVRLMAIDAPELSKTKGEPSQPYAQKAKELLTELTYGKMVEVKGWGLDRHGRVLGVVHVGGKNVNLEMVRAGLAEVYRGRMRKDFDLIPYHQAEQIARNMKLGMWSIGNIYLSPREWRNRKGSR